MTMGSSSNDGDFADNSNFDRDDYFQRASDEDTEDASETEAEKRDEEFTGIKELMYQDQMAQLNRQIQQLKDGQLPQYLKKMKKLEQQYNDALLTVTLLSDDELNEIERAYEEEIAVAHQEFQEKKVELKETLIQDLEHKKKLIESERLTMDLAGDAIGIKQVNTRKLRRRPYDPAPIPEKRSKPSPVQPTCELAEDDIQKDLLLMTKVCKPKVQPGSVPVVQTQRGSMTRSHT